MICLTDKSQCCGCEACRNVCPKQCITLKEDKEGFLYPEINVTTCIKCGLCERVCPMLLQSNKGRMPVAVYAAKHKDDNIRLVSSSGGAFTFLAEKVIEQGGVVFGARFDENWQVVHDYVETKSKLSLFRGSKYVQSRIGNSYQQVQQFLKSGRLVLFTGTSCQILGLKLFLRKQYDNLLAIDVICHGVPSPKVWTKYLNEVSFGHNSQITDISFRNKKNGWHHYFLSIKNNEEVELSNIFPFSGVYSRLFLSDLILRPSCYDCPAKFGKSGSDVTLGDFWGIENVIPEFDDDKGCSVVLAYNSKLLNLFEEMEKREVSYELVKQGNPSLDKSVNCPVNRNYFFHLLCSEKKLVHIYDLCINKSLKQRIRRFMFRKYGI